MYLCDKAIMHVFASQSILKLRHGLNCAFVQSTPTVNTNSYSTW